MSASAADVTCNLNSHAGAHTVQEMARQVVHLLSAADCPARILVTGSGDELPSQAQRWDRSKGPTVGIAFVIAAHAIEGRSLLLASHREVTPNGVGNGSDQVGRNLMDRATQLSWALSSQPVCPYLGPLSTSGIENLGDGPFRTRCGGWSADQNSTK